MDIIESIVEKIRGKNCTIVYPEGLDPRTLGAAIKHQEMGIIHPIVLGNPEEIANKAKELGKDIGELEIIDPNNYENYENMVQAFVERRKGKATLEQAREMLRDRNYFGTMLVYLGLADGMVSGADGPTGDTIRPGLQIIKTRPGANMVSGCMVLIPADETKDRLIFADTAVTIQPTAEQLAEIANETAKTALTFDVEPKVALLSFSTKGSAHSPEQEKVAQAAAIAKEKYPELAVDGELQFDAAYVPEVAKIKAPDSEIAGHARIFVFPDLQAGNIGYKLAQRLGGYTALGPILQGMAKPVNDLSRGCNEREAYELALITAMQAVDQR